MLHNSVLNYTPFGSLMPGRNTNAGGYRYGFQEQECDAEISGEGNSYAFEYRFHDPRLGRFLSIDPLTKDYPHYSPYQFAGNSPICNIDLEGLEDIYYMNRLVSGTENATIKVVFDSQQFQKNMMLFRDPKLNKGYDMHIMEGVPPSGFGPGEHAETEAFSYEDLMRPTFKKSNWGKTIGPEMIKQSLDKKRGLIVIIMPVGSFGKADAAAEQGDWDIAGGVAKDFSHEFRSHVINDMQETGLLGAGPQHNEYHNSPGSQYQWGDPFTSPEESVILEQYPNSLAAQDIRSVNAVVSNLEGRGQVYVAPVSGKRVTGLQMDGGKVSQAIVSN